MRNTSRANRQRLRGQALVEMGIVVLLLVTMLFGIIEFGRMFMLTNMVVHAARDGARVGAVLPSSQVAVVEDHVRDLIGNQVQGLDVQVDYAQDVSPGVDTITVTVTGQIPYIFDFSATGLWNGSLDIARSVTFRHEAAS